jgi:hypothetical protein
MKKIIEFFKFIRWELIISIFIYVFIAILMVIYTSMLIVICTSCKKESIVLTDYVCVECKLHNGPPSPPIDTCGTIQDMSNFIIDIKQKGYDCKTKTKTNN